MSDGTGNTSATLFATNVWRLYQALDLSDPDRQVAYYDDGVGTSSFKPVALLGGIFGFGLKRNVRDIYSFLCRNHNYKAGAPPEQIDRIYGFGFSRGSFTMRVVAGLVASQGLATYGKHEAQLDRDARDAYRLYRNRFKPTQATMRKDRQETAWNWVWGRRVVYFATVFASLYLAALPLINTKWPGLGQASWAEMLIPVVDVVGEVLPNFVSPWIDAFKAAPERLAVGGIALIVLLYLGGISQRSIFDKMRPIWQRIISAGPVCVGPSTEPTDWLYRLRTSPLPRGLLYALSHWVLPFIAALVIYVLLVYVLAVVATRIVFPTATMLGYVCGPAKQPPPDPVKFDTRNLCQPTGVKVVEGKTYRVTFSKGDLPWEDGHKYEKPEDAGIPTGPNGFGWG